MKIKAFIGIFALLATWVVVAQNLVKNPGFEEGATGWGYAAECGMVEAGTGRNGSAGYLYRRTDPSDYHILRQDIKLEPGRRYRFTAWARPATPETDATNIGIILEFSKDGVFLGTQYTERVHEEGTDWDFYRCEFTAGAEGTSYNFGAYLPQGWLGAFVMDNIVIEPLDSEWRFAQILPWGNLAQANDELVFASIFNDLPLDAQAVTLQVLDAEGGEVAKSTHPLQKDSTLHFPLPACQPGDYRVQATLTDKAGAVHGTSELPMKVVSERRRTVEITANGSFVVNGTPFYAIGAFSNGFYDNPDHDEMAELGYNCSLTYPMIADWSKLEEIEQYVGELDKCERLGLKVIFCLKFHFDLANDLAAFQKFVAPWVERVKGHPALLAYFLMDEPPVAKAPLADECRRWLNKIDPDHPVVAVFCNQMNINDFINGVNSVVTDIYPFGGNTHTAVRQLVNLQAIRARGLPVWLCGQAYDMGTFMDCPHYYPTAMEILAQGVTGYISDTGGLLYWMYDYMKKVEEAERRLSEMKWAVALLKDVAPFALAKQPAEPPAWMATVQAKDVAWRIFTDGQGEYRLLVVSTDAPGCLRMELPEGLEFVGSATGLTGVADGMLVFQGKVLPDCDIIKLQRK